MVLHSYSHFHGISHFIGNHLAFLSLSDLRASSDYYYSYLDYSFSSAAGFHPVFSIVISSYLYRSSSDDS